MCSSDNEKTFDNVKPSLLITYSHKYVGFDGKGIRLIGQPYWYQKAEIRLNNDGTTKSLTRVPSYLQCCSTYIYQKQSPGQSQTVPLV